MQAAGLNLLKNGPLGHAASVVRRPAFWLGLQVLLVVLAVQFRFGWAAHEVPDTYGYLQTGKLPVAQMLVSIRTLGYPLFLRTVALVSPNLGLVPVVHFLFHLAAVVLIYRGLRRFGALPWQAFAASSGVLWTIVQDPAVQDLASDCLARSLAVLVIGCLFYVAADPRRVLPWIGLTLLLVAAYQIRPAMLFLVPLVPLLGLVFLGLHAAWHGGPFRWKTPAATLATVAFVPLLGFCLLRWAVVGHFGLVEFGGWNLAGIAIEMLDRPLIDNQLPGEWRPLAREILAAREEAHRKGNLPSAFQDGRIVVAQLFTNYDINVYQAAIPVFRQRYGEEKDVFTNRAINRDLAGMSKAVLHHYRSAYLRFIVQNYLAGLGGILRANLILPFFLALAVSLSLFRNLVWPRPASRPRDSDDKAACFMMQLALVLGVLFTLSSLLLVVLVQMPIGRYLITSALFLPSICALWILQEIELIAAEARLTYGAKRE